MLRLRPRISHGLVAALFLTFFIGLPIGQSPAFAAVGDIDSALTLNGSNQYASVGDSGASPFDSTGTITIEAWVYPTTTCTGSQVIMTKDTSYMMYCYLNKWLYAYSGNGTSWTGNYTSIPVEANAWHHIAFTHSASSLNLKVYYDGVNLETLTANMPTGMTPNNNAFQLGRSATSSYFQGKIDEVRIYSSQRTDAQIVSDMNNYGSITDPNLIAYYDFNDQSGSTVTNEDASPGANTDLTLLNSPTYSNIESTTIINGDQVITFPRTYLNANGGWKIPSYTSSIKSLVVGGGGAGGSRSGGGGGAGGYTYSAAQGVTPNSFQSIVVGQGGIGGNAANYGQGSNGGPSNLGSLITTFGGGGGGGTGFGSGNAPDSYRAGLNGGSGGGATGALTGGGTAQIGGGTTGQGTNGGTGVGSGNYPAGGGGGANQSGGNYNVNTGGSGGAGISDPIAATSICYATGGGGGTYTGYAGGAGGNCGGSANPNGNSGGAGAALMTTPPTTNTGAGGGGNGWTSSTDYAGQSGASGVIILRYALNMSVTLSYSGGTEATYRTVGTITATGSLAGKVTFYERGKAIPGCVRISMNGSNVATCSWKPSLHGSTTITATAKPSNTYVPNGSTVLNLGVVKRTNKR